MELKFDTAKMLTTSHSVSGKVVDAETNEPLPYVNIGVLGINGKPTGLGTVSDENGNFTLDGIPSGHTVQFRFVGYQTNIPLLRANVENVVKLHPKAISVATATVTAKRTYYGIGVLVFAIAALGAIAYYAYQSNSQPETIAQ